MRVVVLTSEPISADLLRAALGDEAEDAEVMVVAPALHDSPVRFWASDADEAIARAQEVQEESVERLEEEGVDDRIVVFTHPGEERAYREDELVAEVERRFGVPVVHSSVSR